MTAAPLAILGASLLGSVHCAAMCGGFVCLYTGDGDSRDATSPRTLYKHAMYNVGRLAAYLALGAAAGLLGSHVTHLSAFAGVTRGAAIVSGALMITWAVSNIASRAGVRVPHAHTPQSWQRAAGWLLLRIRKQPASLRAFATGVFTGALPCGWLYVFVAAAGGTGSVKGGVACMALFWLGTLPALVAVGIGAQRLLSPFRERLPQLSAVVVLITGVLSVTGRFVFAHAH